MDGDTPAVLLRDRDDKFGPAFDRAALRVGAKVIRTAVRAPNMNSVSEGEVNASAALHDGWLIVGARQTLPSPLRGSIWRLDRRGNVLWTADATP